MKAILCLLILISLPTPSWSGQELPITAVGTYMDMRFTEEHAYGYSVELWRQGDTLFGFLLYSEGLAGDTPTGMLEDVSYDPKSGSLSFSARLTIGLFSNREYHGVPSRDVFRFKGRLTKGRLKGEMERSNALTPDELPTKEKLTLKHDGEQSSEMKHLKDYGNWTSFSSKILKFRGPKW